jgi:hypothetical protein
MEHGWEVFSKPSRRWVDRSLFGSQKVLNRYAEETVPVELRGRVTQGIPTIRRLRKEKVTPSQGKLREKLED